MWRKVKPVAGVVDDVLREAQLDRRSVPEGLDAAWVAAVGGVAARETRFVGLIHGTLTVEVASSALLFELRDLRKAQILGVLRGRCPAVRVIRFRPVSG